MKVILGGARGSLPVSGRDILRYGGDTFALLIEAESGGQVLIDAGTGLRRLRPRIRPENRLFFTHTHLDHLIGLPLLTDVWPRELILPRGDLADILKRIYSPPVWPVDLPPATIRPDPVAPLEADGLRVSWHAVAHPDGCLAYRVEEPATGAAVVVATDIEWPALEGDARNSFLRFAAGAGLLLFDAQFLPEEYETHRGWGHSTWRHAIDAANASSIPRLWLIHHGPSRSDDELDALAAASRRAFPGAEVPLAGAEAALPA